MISQATVVAVGVTSEGERQVLGVERRYFSAESMQQTATPTLSSTTKEILAAIA